MSTWSKYLSYVIVAFCLGLLNSYNIFASNDTVQLQWGPNTEEDLAGYNVYHGTKSGVYGFPNNIGNNTTFQMNGLDPNTPHYFSVTAYDRSGNESNPSKEVKKPSSSIQHPLTVTIKGNGTVSSTPSGLTCTPTSCETDFPQGSSISLTPTPQSHSAFSHWSGACSGTKSCTVDMTQAQAVTATFVSSSSIPVININFQPSGAIVPNGYAPDDGSRYTSSRGYGWDQPVSTRERHAHPDQTLDTFIFLSNGTSATWTYDLPNGTYLVSLASGDASWGQGPHHITVEGHSLINRVSTQRNEFVTVTDYPVIVNDGNLTVGLSRDAGKHTMLNYLTIAAIEDPNDNPQLFTLTTTLVGNGTVKSSPSGIFCNKGECIAEFSGDTQVNLTATPQEGWVFTGWKGDCTGTGECSVKITKNTTVSSTFTPIKTQTYPLIVTVAGKGKVSKTNGTLDCTESTQDCIFELPAETSVTFTHSAASGYIFSHWSGACSGTASCTVNMTQAQAVTATFVSSSPTPSSVININFQPSGASVPKGYVPDDGSRYTSSRGYGWDQPVSTRERNAHPDQTLDTFIFLSNGTSATWTYDLPNGTYLVSLASGDASWAQGPHHITVEGNSLISGVSTQRGEFVTVTDYPVVVNDGKLTVNLGRDAGKFAMLNMIRIVADVQSTTPNTDPKPNPPSEQELPSQVNINFQPSGTSVPNGYVPDDGSRYTSSRGYGWNQPVSTRERNAHPDQTLDTFIFLSNGTSATWTYDLPNGTYLISLASGDASWAQGPHHITVEGNSLISGVSTQRGEFVTVTDYPVVVNDGNLTVDLGRDAGKFAMLNYIQITSTPKK